MRHARLTALLLVTAALLAGCRDGRPSAAPDETLPPTTTSTTAPLAPPEPWVPTPNEVEPQLKQAAADTLVALFSYDSGGGTIEATAQRLAAAPADPEVAEQAAPLLDAVAEAAADVIYPQMGGLAGNRASAMVVTRMRWRSGGVDRSETRTVDVRLAKSGGLWRVVELASLGGDPVPVPTTLSELARRVLDHPNIDLPDSARWDIASELIAQPVLEVLVTLADAHAIKVGVLSTGHPIEVFGSAHTSNHIPGRAVDIWWLDGEIVEQRAPDGPLGPILRQLLDAGVTELGAPFVAEGGGNFANLVHQDHLHIGYDRA